MTRDAVEVEALWRRWCRSAVLGLMALTAVIGAAWFALSGHGKAEENGGLAVWAKLAAIYVLFIGYGALNWRAVKRAFLAGKPADEAMRARL